MTKFSLAAALALAVTPAFAQGTGTGTDNQTCTTAPTGITSLSFERSLALNNLVSTANISNNLNPVLLGQLASGALEAREQLNYNAATKTLNSLLFAMAPGSTMPTAQNTIPGNQQIANYSILVDNVYFSCAPVPNVLMAGRISSTGQNNPYGANLNGAPVAVSFGYTTATPPQINNVVVVIAGVVSAYSAAGTGTLGLQTTATPGGPGPGNGGGPVITVAGGVDQITSQRQMSLPFTAVDPTNTQVTYAVTQPTDGMANVPGCEDATRQCTLEAVISDQNTNNPIVTFSSGRGDYLFLVTATNAAGVATTQVVRIRYVGVI